MKTKIRLLLFGLFLLTTNVFSQDPNLYVYLAFGQSNMEGQGPIEAQDQTVDSRFQIMSALTCGSRTMGSLYTAVPPTCRCDTKLSPVDYFGRTMVANLPSNIKVCVINVAVAGCKIELFDKTGYTSYVNSGLPSYMTTIINLYGGNPYGRLVQVAKLAQQKGVIKGILLHQGESNVGDNAWASKVKKIYTDLLTDLSLSAANVPLLAGEVLQGGASAGANTMIDALPNTISTAYVISSSGLAGQSDNLHFTSASYRTFGTRYATKILSLTTTGALSVSTSAISVATAANSTGTFSISASTAWTVTSNQTWLTVSPASGSNNGTVTVTAQQNTGISARSSTVTVSATGATSQTVTVTQNGTGDGSAVNINVGGSATGIFSADQYFTGGTVYTNTATIDMSQITTNAPPAAIFNSERYGAMTYTIPNRTAGSAQTVTLYFAETYQTASGQRLFNVSINGTSVLSNFDIYVSAGGQNKAIAKTFNTTANSSGQVVIQFSTITDNPKVNGISVTDGNVSTIPVTGVSLSQATVSIGTGITSQLTAAIVPTNATNQSVSWNSSNTTVATVGTTGLVTGVAAGTATVTVTTTDGLKTATCSVTVSNTVTTVTGVTLAPAIASVNIGATTQLIVTIVPANATNQSVSWNSSNTAVATVGTTGLVTGVATGSAIITVTTVDQAKTATSSITVTPISTTPCSNPVAITIPFKSDGIGEYCWSTTQVIAYVNSWNMDLVEINGVNYTNKWSNSMPAAINGSWYIHYKSSVAWAHFEASATKSAKVAQEENTIELFPNPFATSISLRIANPELISEIDVIDQTGKVVEKLTKAQISETNQIGNGLLPGMYMVKVVSQHNTNSYKIIKQ